METCQLLLQASAAMLKAVASQPRPGWPSIAGAMWVCSFRQVSRGRTVRGLCELQLRSGMGKLVKACKLLVRVSAAMLTAVGEQPEPGWPSFQVGLGTWSVQWYPDR